MNYFAYGSNMLACRLQERVPSARFLAVAEAPGYEVRFHKRSMDGSGECHLCRSARRGSRALGVVYVIDPKERAALDHAEGLGNGYGAADLVVRCGGESVQVFTDLAEPTHIDAALRPYTWYRDLVVAGAIEHALPADYVESLEAVEAVSDRDRSREERMRSILERRHSGGSPNPAAGAAG
jgi:AIG2-like family